MVAGLVSPWAVAVAVPVAMAFGDPCVEPNVTLSNGLSMPRVGYGCAGRATAASVEMALRAGARLLDTAQAAEWYDEGAVAAGLERSGVDRRQVVVVTKMHPRDHGYKSAAAKVRESAERFGGFVDVFLQHYPTCWDGLCGAGWRDRVEGDWRDSWRAMEDAYESGLVKAIGVSNFGLRDFEALLEFARIAPHVLQTWMDPFHAEVPLRRACERAGVVFMSYSTLGTQWEMQRRGNPVLDSPTLKALGAKHGGRSPAAVALSWAVQRGAVVIPRSRTAKHVEANARTYAPDGTLDLCLPPDDLAVIDALDATTEKAEDDPSVSATFENEGDEALDLFWKDPTTGEVKVGTLAPRDRLAISTYAGHAFVARLPRAAPGAAAVATLVVPPATSQVTFPIADPEAEEL